MYCLTCQEWIEPGSQECPECGREFKTEGHARASQVGQVQGAIREYLHGEIDGPTLREELETFHHIFSNFYTRWALGTKGLVERQTTETRTCKNGLEKMELALEKCRDACLMIEAVSRSLNEGQLTEIGNLLESFYRFSCEGVALCEDEIKSIEQSQNSGNLIDLRSD